jgi:hypothetical protein
MNNTDSRAMTETPAKIDFAISVAQALIGPCTQAPAWEHTFSKLRFGVARKGRFGGAVVRRLHAEAELRGNAFRSGSFGTRGKRRLVDAASKMWLYARLRAFPPQAVLGPCFSTGNHGVRPFNARRAFRGPPAAFGGGRPTEGC